MLCNPTVLCVVYLEEKLLNTLNKKIKYMICGSDMLPSSGHIKKTFSSKVTGTMNFKWHLKHHISYFLLPILCGMIFCKLNLRVAKINSQKAENLIYFALDVYISFILILYCHLLMTSYIIQDLQAY